MAKEKSAIVREALDRITSNDLGEIYKSVTRVLSSRGLPHSQFFDAVRMTESYRHDAKQHIIRILNHLYQENRPVRNAVASGIVQTVSRLEAERNNEREERGRIHKKYPVPALSRMSHDDTTKAFESSGNADELMLVPVKYVNMVAHSYYQMGKQASVKASTEALEREYEKGYAQGKRFPHAKNDIGREIQKKACRTQIRNLYKLFHPDKGRDVDRNELTRSLTEVLKQFDRM